MHIETPIHLKLRVRFSTPIGAYVDPDLLQQELQTSMRLLSPRVTHISGSRYEIDVIPREQQTPRDIQEAIHETLAKLQAEIAQLDRTIALWQAIIPRADEPQPANSLLDAIFGEPDAETEAD